MPGPSSRSLRRQRSMPLGGEFVGKPAKLPDTVPESLVKKIYKFLSKSRAFGAYSYEDITALVAEMEVWNMPEKIEKSFPHYQAGYDQYDRPIWVLEVADCDFMSVVHQGKELVPLWEKSIFLAVYRMLKSMHERDTPDKEVTQCVFLANFKGFKMSQVADPQCLAFLIRMAHKYRDLAVDITGLSIVVNMSLVVQTVSQIFRHIFRSMMDRMVLHGTDEDKWMPKVRQLLPPEVIPPAFGGDENFQPLRQYGCTEKFRKKSIVKVSE